MVKSGSVVRSGSLCRNLVDLVDLLSNDAVRCPRNPFEQGSLELKVACQNLVIVHWTRIWGFQNTLRRKNISQ